MVLVQRPHSPYKYIQLMIILPEESEMNDAEHDSGHDINDTGDRFISYLP
jgi:hypothetical protein